MAMIDNGGPAFPVLEFATGMTLRDYFAAAALQSLYCAVPSNWNDGMEESSRKVADRNWRGELADRAYAMADAMLAERRGSEATNG